MGNLPFRVGDKVMVPVSGPCEIVQRSQLTILDQTKWFFDLKCLLQDELVRIPTEAMQQRGVRPFMSAEEMRQVLDGLAIESCERPFPARYTRWSKLVHSGERGIRAQILGEMHQVGKRRLKSDEVRLQSALTRNFCHEIQAALDIGPRKATQVLQESLQRACS